MDTPTITYWTRQAVWSRYLLNKQAESWMVWVLSTKLFCFFLEWQIDLKFFSETPVNLRKVWNEPICMFSETMMSFKQNLSHQGCFIWGGLPAPANLTLPTEPRAESPKHSARRGHFARRWFFPGRVKVLQWLRLASTPTLLHLGNCSGNPRGGF